MMLRQILHRLLPARLLKFFQEGEECSWQSPLSQKEILDRLKRTLPARGRFGAVEGVTGRVAGNEIQVTWRGRMMNSFDPVFRGMIAASPATGGSVITGAFSAHRGVRLFLAFWTGGVLLFALLTFWTLLFPLIAWGMLWLVNGLLLFCEATLPNGEAFMRNYLLRVASPDIDVPDIVRPSEDVQSPRFSNHLKCPGT